MDEPSRSAPVVVLTGFMGAGKTTVGNILAQRLGLPFVDSDVMIEQRAGRTIREIFAADGEPYFRDLEHRTVRELVDSAEAVIALGGGAIEDPRTRECLRAARVVHLHVGFAEALGRVEHDEFRPMLKRDDLEDVYARRQPSYRELADVSIETNGRRPDAIALEILGRLSRAPSQLAGASSVFVTPVGGSYHAHVGRGVIDHAAGLMPALGDAENAFVLRTRRDDERAARVGAQLESLGLSVSGHTLAEGSALKSFGMVAEIADHMAAQAIHRRDLVVGVGGEEVCDVAGFVAATFNRGMPLALVPTTLAAQADSSIGGKNGLHVRGVHNLVGTIHQPIVVLCDVDAVRANGDHEFRDGLAEAAKHALLRDDGVRVHLEDTAPLLLAHDPEALRRTITQSLTTKAEVVSRDERESGERAHLNYGHTFAHAFEAARGGRLADGEALGLGLMAAAHLSHRLGRLSAAEVEAHRSLLSRLGLPTQGTFVLSELTDPWRRDKKYRHGTRFVVLNRLGAPEAGVGADDAVLAAALKDLAAG